MCQKMLPYLNTRLRGQKEGTGTMAAHKPRWLLAWVISLSVMPALLSGCESVTSGTPREVEAAAEREQDWHPSAQEGRWQAHMDAGIKKFGKNFGTKMTDHQRVGYVF